MYKSGSSLREVVYYLRPGYATCARQVARSDRYDQQITVQQELLFIRVLWIVSRGIKVNVV